jgi:hypothetical protein
MERPATKPGFFDRLGRVDRRWIYLAIALAVIIPLAARLTFPVITTPIVQGIFDKLDGLPEGSRVIVTADFAPSTAPENMPMLQAVLRHALHQKLKVYLLTLWATGIPQLAVVEKEVLAADFPGAVAGRDWVNLGYKAGNQGVINAAFSDFPGTFPVDAKGNDVRTLPIMQGVKRISDFNLIVAIGSGFPGVKEWIQFGGDPARVPVAAGVTAVEAPLLYPYYPKQLLGLMGGLQGAAEYEAALVKRYPQYLEHSQQAIRRMGPQTVAHLVIIAFILLGNAAYFAGGNAGVRGKRS